MKRGSLEAQRAALAAYKTRFPVLVLDGDATTDADAFRATLYGADRQPIGEPMRLEEAKRHFMNRLATRVEWDAQCAKATAE